MSIQQKQKILRIIVQLLQRDTSFRAAKKLLLQWLFGVKVLSLEQFPPLRIHRIKTSPLLLEPVVADLIVTQKLFESLELSPKMV